MKTAMIFGATGLVGSLLLRDLLDRPEYAQVVAYTRRNLEIVHPKLRTRKGDFQTLVDSDEPLETDELFLALGTNRQKTPDRKEYYRIDHDYPVLAAERAKQGGAASIWLLSALGADPSSRAFYFQTKGETERDIVALGYEQTHIFRPSMIVGQRKEYGPFEKAMATVWTTLNPLLRASLDKYRAITAADIAKAMATCVDPRQTSINIYQWREISSLLSRAKL